jgi:hypothetical protein
MDKALLPIVVIHGVGSPEPGATAIKVAKLFGDGSEYRTKTEIEADISIPVVEVSGKEGESATIWEANWADLSPAGKGVIPTILFFIRIQFGMIQIAESGWMSDRTNAGGGSTIGALFRYATVCLALWSILPSIAIIFALTTKSHVLAAFFVVSVAFFGSLTAWLLARYEPLARFGHMWSLAALLLGIGALAFPAQGKEMLNRAAEVVTATEILSGSLLAMGVAETWLKYFNHRGDARQPLVRSALYILPLSLIGGLVALVMASTLWVLQWLDKYEFISSELDCVLNGMGDHFGYNVEFMEVVNGTATFAVLSLLCLAIGLWQLLLLFGFVDGLPWGSVFRRIISVWLTVLLLLSLIVLFAFIAAFIADMSLKHSYVKDFRFATCPWISSLVSSLTPGRDSGPRTALDIYKYSSLRLLPVVLAAIPSLRMPLNIAGDILFYLLPSSSPLSTGTAA